MKQAIDTYRSVGTAAAIFADKIYLYVMSTILATKAAFENISRSSVRTQLHCAVIASFEHMLKSVGRGQIFKGLQTAVP